MWPVPARSAYRCKATWVNCRCGGSLGNQSMSGAERSSRSDRVRIVEERLLSDDWYVLKKTTFEYRGRDGRWQRQSRETYDRGNGAVLLLFNVERSTVVLIRQFRFPTFVNGSMNGLRSAAWAAVFEGA